MIEKKTTDASTITDAKEGNNRKMVHLKQLHGKYF